MSHTELPGGVAMIALFVLMTIAACLVVDALARRAARADQRTRREADGDAVLRPSSTAFVTSGPLR
jgi:hypothetical protein